MKNNAQIPTLTDRDVERMSEAGRESCLAISLYLGVRADRDFLAVANSLFTEGEKKIEMGKNFNHNDKEAIKAVFSGMEEKLRVVKLPDRTRTFILFFDNSGGLRIYKVPVYIPSRVVVEKDLYIHPLIKNLQRYPSYGVVFLQRDRAKIFNYFWGEVVDETPEIKSDVPQRMNAARASWKGLSESRILKHIDVHIDWHLKKVADETDTYMRKNKIPYLVIGSHRELCQRFKEHLPNTIQQKIVGSYLIRTDQSLSRIKQKSLETIDKFEFEKERNMIERIFEGNSKREKAAALGIELVLEKLSEYKIYTLVIGKNYAPKGYLCSNNHRVYSKNAKKQVCTMPLLEVSDIADELIETAIANKVRIIHLLHDHEDFDKFGIGAILK